MGSLQNAEKSQNSKIGVWGRWTDFKKVEKDKNRN